MNGNGVCGGKASLGIFVFVSFFLRLERKERLSHSRCNRKELVAHEIYTLDVHERKRRYM